MFYYSEYYGGYTGIVDSDATAEDILDSVVMGEGSCKALTHNGDVTGDGKVTAGDAAYVSIMLHNPDGTYTDYERLNADVCGGTDESAVSTSDCYWILREALGFN